MALRVLAKCKRDLLMLVYREWWSISQSLCQKVICDSNDRILLTGLAFHPRYWFNWVVVCQVLMGFVKEHNIIHSKSRFIIWTGRHNIESSYWRLNVKKEYRGSMSKEALCPRWKVTYFWLLRVCHFILGEEEFHALGIFSFITVRLFCSKMTTVYVTEVLLRQSQEKFEFKLRFMGARAFEFQLL
jgi:hypothetical protein